MTSCKEYNDLCLFLLDHTGQPVPRWRILRDLLQMPLHDNRIIDTQACLSSSHRVKELIETQLPDGSWGRFHSRDSRLKSLFPTTELAIRRALSLGLDKNSEILSKTIDYLHDILSGATDWIDPAEKHEGWPINVRIITAATLALIDPTDPAIRGHAQTWTEIVRQTFASGSFSAEAERAAHLRIHGIHTRGKYLKLASLYPLLLLSNPASGLDSDLEKKLLEWVWHKEGGIYYVFGDALSVPPAPNTPHFADWLWALDLLSRFPAAINLLADTINWLWQQRGELGLWDFGANARNNSFILPLSENWKNPFDRKVDCSILALDVIRKYLTE
jgi:hypothetical protein